jgi:hypothetical protein
MKIPTDFRMKAYGPTASGRPGAERLVHGIPVGGTPPRGQAPTGIWDVAGILGREPNPVARALWDLERSGYRPLHPG